MNKKERRAALRRFVDEEPHNAARILEALERLSWGKYFYGCQLDHYDDHPIGQALHNLTVAKKAFR